MNDVLIISDSEPGDSDGRAADLEARAEYITGEGWTQHVLKAEEPYLLTFLPVVLQSCWFALREDVDVVVSQSNPFHLQVVGVLCSLVARKPWIAEIRDPMVTNPDREPGAPVTKAAKFVEWLMVRRAAVVVWTDGMQMEEDYFERTYPKVDASKFVKLPFKGYPREEFESASTESFDAFTITYAGSFYEGWIEPDTFFDGLEQYLADSSEAATDIDVRFYGDWAPEYDTAVADRDLEEVVSHHEFIPKTELIPKLNGSDVLLYIGGTDPRNELNVPSKIWDYVGARAPILAVVDPSFRVAEFVRDNDIGVVTSPANPDEIASALEQLRTEGYEVDPAAAETHVRERKLAELVAVYEDVAGE